MNDLLIVLHIPKTAGSSLVRALSERLAPHHTLSLYGIQRTSAAIAQMVSSMEPVRRDALRLVAGHQVWFGIHDLFPNHVPRYITFLRDPVARVLSNYWKIVRDPNHALHAAFANQQPSMEEFVSGRVIRAAINHMTVYLGRSHVDDEHNVKQCVKQDPELMAAALDNLSRFWFVGLKARYRLDLGHLSELLGVQLAEHAIHRPTTIPVERKSAAHDVIEACHDNNRMDSLVYHHATIINEWQEPDPVAFAPSRSGGSILRRFVNRWR